MIQRADVEHYILAQSAAPAQVEAAMLALYLAVDRGLENHLSAEVLAIALGSVLAVQGEPVDGVHDLIKAAYDRAAADVDKWSCEH